MAETSHEKANNSESNRVSKYKTEIVVETKEGLELARSKENQENPHGFSENDSIL